jgi:hypothetical protein
MPAGAGGGMRGRRPPVATTLVAADATTVLKIGARVPHCQGLRFSVGTFSARVSGHGTTHRRTSQSTLGKRTLDCGSRITSSLAKQAAWIVIISVSAISPCSWPIRANVAGAPFAQRDSKLGGFERGLCGQLQGHLFMPWEPLGSENLST